MAEKESVAAEKKPENPQKKRDVISQTVIPHLSLKRALSVPKAIFDHYGSKETLPHVVASAVGYSPASFNWRVLSGAAVAYGLTNGAYNSKKGISLTDLATKIFMPAEPGQKDHALIECALKPKILNDFFKKYDRQKFPQKEYAVNALVTMMGVPRDRAEETYEVIKETGEFVGIITETKTGPFVSIEISPASVKKDNEITDLSTDTPSQRSLPLDSTKSIDEMTEFAAAVSKKFDQETRQVPSSTILQQKTNRVFVSHGKNKRIVEQLKDLLQYGKYEPIISVERESTSKPVPEKVLDDMRSCFAGVILINTEEELIDKNGQTRKKINDNVLIEIGAALALYRHNNILLVQKGVDLPSNLQGLYRCEYEGDTLDITATLKLLKGFNDFK